MNCWWGRGPTARSWPLTGAARPDIVFRIGTEIHEQFRHNNAWQTRSVFPAADHVTFQYAGAETDVFWLALQGGGQLHLLKKIASDGSWILRASLPTPTGVLAAPRLDAHSRIGTLAWLEREAGVDYLVAASSQDNGSAWSAPTRVSRNEWGGVITGRYLYGVTPIMDNREGGVLLVTTYGEGDPPPENPGLLRLARPTVVRCTADLTDCTGPPGALAIDRAAIQPLTALMVACDEAHTLCTLAYSAWQRGEYAEDIFALTLRVEDE